MKAQAQIRCCDLTTRDSIEYFNDKPFAGICTWYYYPDVPASRHYYLNGMLDSVSTYWDKKGNKLSEVRYAAGKADGEAKYFYKNGILEQSVEYKNDEKCGFVRDYYKNGKIRKEEEWDGEYIVNDFFYKWNKKGEKYKYTYITVSHNSHVGKLNFHSSRDKVVKTKVTVN